MFKKIAISILLLCLSTSAFAVTQYAETPSTTVGIPWIFRGLMKFIFTNGGISSGNYRIIVSSAGVDMRGYGADCIVITSNTISGVKELYWLDQSKSTTATSGGGGLPGGSTYYVKILDFDMGGAMLPASNYGFISKRDGTNTAKYYASLSTTDSIHLEFMCDRWWNSGQIEAQVYFVANSTFGSVNFEIAFATHTIGGSDDSALYNTNGTFGDNAVPTTAYLLDRSTLVMTPAANQWQKEGMVTCRIKRVPASAECSVDAEVRRVVIYYETTK